LFRHDALMHACAIDVSREHLARIDQHKAGQCDGMTKHLTDEHHPDLVREGWDLRRVLEGMPRQLYIQCVMMKELVRIASEQVTLYFAQRRPRELAKFEWTIDAKDPRRITSQEKWWRETLAALLESASRREPFVTVKDAGGNATGVSWFGSQLAGKGLGLLDAQVRGDLRGAGTVDVVHPAPEATEVFAAEPGERGGHARRAIELLDRRDATLLARRDREAALAELHVQELLQLPARLADQIPSGHPGVRSSVRHELRHVLPAHEHRLERSTQRRGQRALADHPSFQPGIVEQLANVLRKAALVGKGNSEHRHCITHPRGVAHLAAGPEGLNGPISGTSSNGRRMLIVSRGCAPLCRRHAT